MSALVSICIPAHNAERWLAETIASARAQTYPHIEVIVVDDGSTDRTRAIAERQGVVAISQPNAGPGAARNLATRYARGDYIQFLDADDLLSPDKIEASVRLLEAHGDPLSFAVSRWARFTRSIAELEYHEEPTFRDWESFALMYHMSTEEACGMQPTGSWLVPRSLLDRVGPWSEERPISPIDDGEYLYRLLAQATFMRFAPEGMLYYRSGIGGLNSVRTPQAIEGIYRSRAVMMDALRSREDSARTRAATARSFQTFIYENYAGASKSVLLDAIARVRQFGGVPRDLEPAGGPKFQTMRRIVGWRLARRLERVWRQRLRLQALHH